MDVVIPSKILQLCYVNFDIALDFGMNLNFSISLIAKLIYCAHFINLISAMFISLAVKTGLWSLLLPTKKIYLVRIQIDSLNFKWDEYFAHNISNSCDASWVVNTMFFDLGSINASLLSLLPHSGQLLSIN